MGQVDARAVLKMSWNWDLPGNLGAVCLCWVRTLCAPTRAVVRQMHSAVPAPLGEQPFGDTAGAKRVRGSPTCSCQPVRGGKRRPHQSWWITDRACGVVCCHQRSVRWDARLEWGPVIPVGLEGCAGGVHPGLAGWQKMCFLGAFKVAWFAFRRGKESAWNR